MRLHPAARPGLAPLRPLVVALAACGAAAAAPLRARADGPGPDRLERPGGPTVEGRLLFDPQAGFRFQSAGESGAPAQVRAVGPGGVVGFAPGPPPATTVPPLFQAGLGESGRISGTLRAIAEDAVTLAVPWQAVDVVVRRPGVQSLVQRLGEARVLADGFDALDAAAWGVVGQPRAVAEGGETAVLLPPGGSSIERRFEEPIESGRVDLTFRDDGVVRPGQRWTLTLTFRAPGGPADLRVLLGWAEESLAVEAPDGPALPVQRLARTDGWRRLSIRFGGDRTEVSVDGKDLAHGRGPAGPLESIRVATVGEPTKDAGPGGYVGAIQAARFAPVASSLEIDPTQDEARLVVGDQFYGTVRRGDRDRVEMLVDDRPLALDWKDLAGLFFRRAPAAGAPVAGALARVEWRAGGDEPGRAADFAEGAVTALTDAALTLATPFAGTLTIPRDRLVRIRVAEPGLRLVVDPCAHHLGNEFFSKPPLLDPPMPEGGVLERPFVVPADAGAGPAFVVLDVLGVVGEATGLAFSENIRRGELKTYVAIDGRRVDYLNRHVAGSNESPERIRVPIPADALRPGPHVLRIEQTGLAASPTEYDDMGILGVAIEFAAAGAPRADAGPAAAPAPPRP
ncbi:hypothetical protein [Paludisphaera mucosa]|uniref:Uncharacterized protein n=1 Tax=Paludisphaera mucosa TaxID=3030827 RepID=A0ABT6FAT9_9BACT|nr:hypothetical protein [Paludisphaera mucosa]MDG3004495.1 hypothetical protein [Paludisphaera mucosa]